MYFGKALLLFTRTLQCLQHFNRSLHVGLSDPTCVQNIRPVSLMIFEILGFKLKKKKNDNDNKNWRNG